MSEFLFGVGRGRVDAKKAKQVDAIARRHGARFITATMPGDGPKYWFSGPNAGFPFDRDMAEDVHADLAAAGIVLP